MLCEYIRENLESLKFYEDQKSNEEIKWECFPFDNILES